MKPAFFFSSLSHKIRKSRILSGALLLSAAGMISRVIGFFYRIFLSRTFGAENIGIYQLIGPVMALAYSVSAAGFQTAISRITATACATAASPDIEQKKGPKITGTLRSYTVLAAGMVLSLALSLGISCFVYFYNEEIAARFLLEARCAPLLKILALSFPVSSIHSCVSGYFYGKKSAGFPAFSQLFEQVVRVGAVLFLCNAFLTETTGKTPDISFAVIGMVIGEAFSAILSLLYLWHCFRKELRFCASQKQPSSMNTMERVFSIPALFPNLFMMAIPLSAGRVIQNFLQSIEAIAIPDKLRMFGLDTASALSEYGILTGMSLPFILFPTALTGSIAVMLLPAVSEAQALRRERTIARAVHRSVSYCLLLGFFCLVFFLLCGPVLGKFVFHQQRAGTYLQILGFMCPFLYMNSTLSSILHGLGKTISSFFYNMASLLVRLVFVFFCIPVFGIRGYLWALLASQILLSVLQLIALRRYLRM